MVPGDSPFLGTDSRFDETQQAKPSAMQMYPRLPITEIMAQVAGNRRRESTQGVLVLFDSDIQHDGP